MNRFLVLMSLAACATPSTPGADSARNADATPAPRSQAAQVLVPNSPLLDDAIATAPEDVHDADVDPVCGMKVNPETARGGSVTRNGHTYHFCSSTCRNTFLARDGGTP